MEDERERQARIDAMREKEQDYTGRGYTAGWVIELREGRGLEAPDEKRKQLNIAIAKIASEGCGNVYVPARSHPIQKAAGLIMNRARQQEKEPLELLINVCDGYEGLDVYPESLLIAAKYVEV
jgi:hypothetical protein